VSILFLKFYFYGNVTKKVSGIARTINTRIHNDLPPDSKGEKAIGKTNFKKGKSRNSLRE